MTYDIIDQSRPRYSRQTRLPDGRWVTDWSYDDVHWFRPPSYGQPRYSRCRLEPEGRWVLEFSCDDVNWFEDPDEIMDCMSPPDKEELADGK